MNATTQLDYTYDMGRNCETPIAARRAHPRGAQVRCGPVAGAARLSDLAFLRGHVNANMVRGRPLLSAPIERGVSQWISLCHPLEWGVSRFIPSCVQ